MTEFKVKRPCFKRYVTKEQDPPFQVLKDTLLVRYRQLNLLNLDIDFVEVYEIEGDNQRSSKWEGSYAQWCIPYVSILMDNISLIHFVFIDSKKCADFDKGQYIPWPLTQK